MKNVSKYIKWLSDNLITVMTLLAGAMFFLWRREQGKRIEAETEKDVIQQKEVVKQAKEKADEAQEDYEDAKRDWADVSRKHRSDGQ